MRRTHAFAHSHWFFGSSVCPLWSLSPCTPAEHQAASCAQHLAPPPSPTRGVRPSARGSSPSPARHAARFRRPRRTGPRRAHAYTQMNLKCRSSNVRVNKTQDSERGLSARRGHTEVLEKRPIHRSFLLHGNHIECAPSGRTISNSSHQAPLRAPRAHARASARPPP